MPVDAIPSLFGLFNVSGLWNSLAPCCWNSSTQVHCLYVAIALVKLIDGAVSCGSAAIVAAEISVVILVVALVNS